MRFAWLMPRITHLFGLKPWELELLTQPELDAYVRAAQQRE